MRAALTALFVLSAGAARADEPGCAQQTFRVGEGVVGYKASGKVCGGKREGEWVFRYLDGTVLRKGEYRAGREEGRWTSYDHEGRLIDEKGYKAGRPDGPWVHSHPNGARAAEGVYFEGLKDGVFRRFDRDGKRLEERVFRKGRRNGTDLRWDARGRLVYIRECREDDCAVVCEANGRRRCSLKGEPAKSRAKGPKRSTHAP